MPHERRCFTVHKNAVEMCFDEITVKTVGSIFPALTKAWAIPESELQLDNPGSGKEPWTVQSKDKA
jgi:hypothetical protein